MTTGIEENADGSPESRPQVPGLTPEELKAAFAAQGIPAYRAAQVWRWAMVQGVDDWDAMTNVPSALRARLAEAFVLSPTAVSAVQRDPTGTRKLLLTLADGEAIECVLIPAARRMTVCVSSQAGCRHACVFCASGRSGFRRHLTAGEMVDQVRQASRVGGIRATHVVFMGIGEPFDNYDAVLQAVRVLNDPVGMPIGARRITLSTSGVIPGIRRLAGEGLQVELAVSLHAPDDELRSALMPINRRYPLADLIAACGAYTRQTRRIITFEYTLIRDVNDAPDLARALARLLGAFPCRVNLIPLSPVPEYPREAATPETLDLFLDVLTRAGINATMRFSRGKGVNAACGQLRRAAARKEPAP